MKIKKTCCITSLLHEEMQLTHEESIEKESRIRAALRKELIRLIEDEQVCCFMSGVLPGTDMTAAELVLELKEKYPNITLECVIAYEQLPLSWSETLRDRYFNVLERCDREILLQYHYSTDCIKNKNLFLLKFSDFIITNGREDETYYIYSSPVVCA